jgi:hypothetical protein
MADETLSDIAKENAKFLDRDFIQCFTQMRHYDSQMVDVCKFAFGAYTTAVGASLALFKYGLEAKVDYAPAAQAILMVALLLGIAMVSLIVRNRVYFVIVTRYVNEHRGFFLSSAPLGFQNHTRMYTNAHQPPFFDWRSSQSLLLYILCVLNTGLLGTLIYMFSPGALGSGRIVVPVAAFLLVELGWAVSYLLSRERKSVGKAVFGKA